jgi:RHS repeat-associated protein
MAVYEQRDKVKDTTLTPAVDTSESKRVSFLQAIMVISSNLNLDFVRHFIAGPGNILTPNQLITLRSYISGGNINAVHNYLKSTGAVDNFVLKANRFLRLQQLDSASLTGFTKQRTVRYHVRKEVARYGAARLGIDDAEVLLDSSLSWSVYNPFSNEWVPILAADSVALPAIDSVRGHFRAGHLKFEISNHLGNVLAVVGDHKLGVSTSLNIHHFTADLYSARSYYPFGLPMPGRTWERVDSAGKYRFGFNGKENLDVAGWQDYGFRLYDISSARFLTPDPLIVYGQMNCYLSSYQFARLNPILMMDWMGLDGEDKTKCNADNDCVLESVVIEDNAPSRPQSRPIGELGSNSGNSIVDALKKIESNAVEKLENIASTAYDAVGGSNTLQKATATLESFGNNLIDASPQVQAYNLYSYVLGNGNNHRGIQMTFDDAVGAADNLIGGVQFKRGNPNFTQCAIKKPQIHHMFTNKHSFWTSMFNSVLSKYKDDFNNPLTVDGNWNQILMESHGGRHSDNYHKIMFDRLIDIDRRARGNTKKFLKLYYKNVVEYVKKNPQIMY